MMSLTNDNDDRYSWTIVQGKRCLLKFRIDYPSDISIVDNAFIKKQSKFDD